MDMCITLFDNGYNRHTDIQLQQTYSYNSLLAIYTNVQHALRNEKLEESEKRIAKKKKKKN